MSVRPSVHPSTKSFFDFNNIWYVGRRRRVMHDGVQYDPIQGQGQGHEPLKVGNSAIFKRYLLPVYNGAGKWARIILQLWCCKLQYLKLIGAEFLTFVPVFLCHVILKLAVSRSRPPVPYGANSFLIFAPNRIFGIGEARHFNYRVRIDTEES